MKVADKIDWFEYSLYYTKKGVVDNCPEDLLSISEIHNGVFGDNLIRAFCGDFSSYSDPAAAEKLILDFFCFCLPDEFIDFFDLTQWRFCPRSVTPYRWNIEVGDPTDRVFHIYIPMMECDESCTFYSVFNARRGCFDTYNATVGYKIVISGHNMPVDKLNGVVYPVRIDSFSFIKKVQALNTLFLIKRLDVALDVAIHFYQIADLFLSSPYSFKLPFYHNNRFIQNCHPVQQLYYRSLSKH